MPKAPSEREALTTTCPVCGAAPEKRCLLNDGKPRAQLHKARYDRKRTLTNHARRLFF